MTITPLLEAHLKKTRMLDFQLTLGKYIEWWKGWKGSGKCRQPAPINIYSIAQKISPDKYDTYTYLLLLIHYYIFTTIYILNSIAVPCKIKFSEVLSIIHVAKKVNISCGTY